MTFRVLTADGKNKRIYIRRRICALLNAFVFFPLHAHYFICALCIRRCMIYVPLFEFYLHFLITICETHNFREHSIQISRRCRLKETSLIAMTTWPIIDLISCYPRRAARLNARSLLTSVASFSIGNLCLLGS